MPVYFVASFDLHVQANSALGARIAGSLGYHQMAPDDLRIIYTYDALLIDDDTGIEIWGNPLIEIDEDYLNPSRALLTVPAGSISRLTAAWTFPPRAHRLSFGGNRPDTGFGFGLSDGERGPSRHGHRHRFGSPPGGAGGYRPERGRRPGRNGTVFVERTDPLLILRTLSEKI
jgi:hypothetical protein